jgi:hypothetical protein
MTKKACQCGCNNFVVFGGRASYSDTNLQVDGEYLEGAPEEGSNDEEDNCFEFMNEQTVIPEKALALGINNDSSGSYITFSLTICTACRRVQE